jgi:hypothetical protein
MNKTDMLELAEQYLINRKIDFVRPGKFGCVEGNRQEVIFLDPLVLDPRVAVVDPGDIRVWVNAKTKEVTLADQM